MRFSEFNTGIPDWVRSHMRMQCKYCESYIVDNSDMGNGITKRCCPNPKCPGHMSFKMDKIAKTLGIKNFGPATALDFIRVNKSQSHLDILQQFLGDNKPIMKLSDIANIACIEGYSSTTGEKELNSFKSFEDYFNNTKTINKVLWQNREILYIAESYFTTPTPMAKTKILVMGHDPYNNFNNRKEFFDQVNDAFGSILQVVETGLRKTGVSYLIMEDSSPRSGRKYEVAKERGIPIVSPEQFVNILTSYTHT